MVLLSSVERYNILKCREFGKIGLVAISTYLVSKCHNIILLKMVVIVSSSNSLITTMLK